MKNLIIIIDLWEKAINDIKNLNKEYTNDRINNIIQLLSYVKNNNNFDICNANYCELICTNKNDCRCNNHTRKILQEIIDMNINFINMKSVNITNYNNIYLLGLSFDGCILNRELGYLYINHKNKFIIRDCCLNENPIRGDIVNKYFNIEDNKNDANISDICPQKWIKNNKIEWNGPYYYFKNINSILKYENFIIDYFKLNIINYNNLLI